MLTANTRIVHDIDACEKVLILARALFSPFSDMSQLVTSSPIGIPNEIARSTTFAPFHIMFNARFSARVICRLGTNFDLAR